MVLNLAERSHIVVFSLIIESWQHTFLYFHSGFSQAHQIKGKNRKKREQKCNEAT